jgi:hypothetical protein
MRQKGVHCMSITIFNSLPDYLIDLAQKLKDVLIHNPSYIVDEFLLFCRDQQLRNRRGIHAD